MDWDINLVGGEESNESDESDKRDEKI